MALRVTKGDVEFYAKGLARLMGSTDSPKVVVHHGNWSGYHIATVVTFTWPDDTVSTLTLSGTKRDQVRSLQVAMLAVQQHQSNNMREA